MTLLRFVFRWILGSAGRGLPLTSRTGTAGERFKRCRGDVASTISPLPTHAELTARVSSHRAAVTRELNYLESAGLLERRRSAIVIRDPERLAKLLEDDENE
jgi:hypothetical protein